MKDKKSDLARKMKDSVLQQSDHYNGQLVLTEGPWQQRREENKNWFAYGPFN